MDQIDPAQLVAAMAPADGPPRNAIVIWGGFLVRSVNDRNNWRLYLTIGFDEYVEFNQDDLIYAGQVNPRLNPLGGTVVWVDAGAELHYTSTQPRVREAQFLQGPITRNVLPQGAQAAPGGQGGVGW